uniref:Uncharacterized protein n=1 Tax=Arundo donax TaxID=35708 RepID=A0A0A9A7U1_ARUDO
MLCYEKTILCYCCCVEILLDVNLFNSFALK